MENKNSRRDFLKLAGYGAAGTMLFPRLGKTAGGVFQGLEKPFDSAQGRPNIIFILADDLGYGDVGCFGQTKIRTPNIDRLAAEGMRFTQHYAGNNVCAPSRCVLMTGLHPGHAYIRNNRQVPGTEGQFPIPLDTVTLPKLLKQQGYATGAFGKWGLGGPGTTGDAFKQGFDPFYGYLSQTEAHNYYPDHLWLNDRKVMLDNPVFAWSQRFPADADPHDAKNYTRYAGKVYSADVIAAQAREFIRANQQRPFFLYFATTVPHVALQVPEDSLAEYLGKWPDAPYLGDHNYLPHRAPRAAYAAMITRMDREVGRIMDLVKELGLEKQTLFVFSSDNGPVGDKIGGADCDFFQSAGPLRGRKGSNWEGGIREPTIARWKGRIPAGITSEQVSGFEDWLPTLLEVAGAKKLIPARLDGISLMPTLLGETQPPRPFLYRESPGYGGQQSIRVGDWKGIRMNLNKDMNAPLELYNLKNDIAETKNVAADHPDIVAQMLKTMKEQHTPSKDFPLPGIDR